MKYLAHEKTEKNLKEAIVPEIYLKCEESTCNKTCFSGKIRIPETWMIRGKMSTLVAVKRVLDPYVKIRVKSDKSGVETANTKMAMNPFDEIALEEALRIRERNETDEIIVVSIGSETSTETLRHALALGANRAILVKTDLQYESLNIAKILKKIAEQEKVDLILMGKQSIDGDNNQTPQMLAGILNWPQATFASKIIRNESSLEVTREIDGGLETRKIDLPAVISVDLRLNEPRYAKMPDIMKAKSKPLSVIDIDSLGLDLRQHREILEVSSPATRQTGMQVQSVDELLDKLRNEAKVL